GSRVDPTKEFHPGSRLVIRAARSRSAKWLLSDNGARWFVIDVKIARGESQRAMRICDSGAVGGKNAAGQTVRRRRVDDRQYFFPLLFRIDVQRDNWAEQLFAHGPIIGPAHLDECRLDEISNRIIRSTARDDLSVLGSARILYIAGQLLERRAINHGPHEIPKISYVPNGKRICRLNKL